ncbi:MAG: glycosyltransferase [bacterium]
MANRRLLYVVNFYGTPPLNFLSKYLAENTDYHLTVLKLPAMSPAKNGMSYEAFLINENGHKEYVRFLLPLKVPPVLTLLLQYVFNLYAAFKLVSKKGTFDLAVGETSFGSAVVRWYKILGRVKKTVFMSGDVLPIFEGKIKPYYLHSENAVIQAMDKLFIFVQLALRKIGMTNDVVWYASEKTREWDLENNIKAKAYFTAPAVTIDKNEALCHLETAKTENILAYFGRLDQYAGVDVSLEALALIRKELPEARLVLVGGSETAVNKYRALAKDLGVEQYVDFKGFVEKTEDALALISQAKLGLALYKPDKENVSLYADVSKPKEYLRAGLPVVMSHGGPYLGIELETLGAAVLTDFSPVEIAKTCVAVLQNTEKYQKLLKGVGNAAHKYDYRENFRMVVAKIEELTKH